MLQRLVHRGPDGEGIQGSNGGTIGSRRLAIIDIAGGHQPMANENGSVLAVQNGEIYNFQDLRRELEQSGHVFRTRNDTEILPHAYEEWGPDLVRRLHGMFAIAIWDAPRRTLLLARDRFGKKPLMYSAGNGVFCFASEINALSAHPSVARDVDPVAIDQYLTFGYVPAPRTGFAAIRKLPPAHILIVRDGVVEAPERYWHLTFTPKEQISLDDATAEVRRLIDESVRRRLISDVPIGAFLSGGLDSSTVVAYMARHSERPVKTFSIGFADSKYDELEYARVVARAFGTDHHELVVDADNIDVLPMLVRHLGEPFADSSIVPSFHVARITRAEVTVALNGDGGDELFAGYDRYKAAALAHQVNARLPASVVRGLSVVARAIPRSPRLPRQLAQARRFLDAMGLAPEAQFLRWTGCFTGPLHELIAGGSDRRQVSRSGHGAPA